MKRGSSSQEPTSNNDIKNLIPSQKKRKFNDPANDADDSSNKVFIQVNTVKDSSSFTLPKNEKDLHPPINAFSELEKELGEKLLHNIKKMGYENPTQIQSYALAILMKDKKDIVGIAKTGSGKTAAFLFPIISAILANKSAKSEKEDEDVEFSSPIGLILSPTRELATQINKECEKYCKGTGIHSMALYGGDDKKEQLKKLKQHKYDILVCTPGRLIDFISEGATCPFVLSEIKFFVMDEADRMLEEGFTEQLRKIITIGRIPKERQTMLFSATFVKEVQYIALNYLSQDHVFLRIGSKKFTANPDVSQKIVSVAENDKIKKLIEVLRDFEKKVWEDKANKTPEENLAIVFCETKISVSKIESILSRMKIFPEENEGSSKKNIGFDFSEQNREDIKRLKKEKAKLMFEKMGYRPASYLEQRKSQNEAQKIEKKQTNYEEEEEEDEKTPKSEEDAQKTEDKEEKPSKLEENESETDPLLEKLVEEQKSQGKKAWTAFENNPFFSICSLTGDKSQEERNNTITTFKTGDFQILVATDLAARGIDVEKITLVVNFDFPKEFETYIHRIGRTGRAGRKGASITFFNRNSAKFSGLLIDCLKSTENAVPEWLEKIYKENENQETVANTDLKVKAPRGSQLSNFFNYDFNQDEEIETNKEIITKKEEKQEKKPDLDSIDSLFYSFGIKNLPKKQKNVANAQETKEAVEWILESEEAEAEEKEKNMKKEKNQTKTDEKPDIDDRVLQISKKIEKSDEKDIRVITAANGNRLFAFSFQYPLEKSLIESKFLNPKLPQARNLLDTSSILKIFDRMFLSLKKYKEIRKLALAVKKPNEQVSVEEERRPDKTSAFALNRKFKLTPGKIVEKDIVISRIFVENLHSFVSESDLRKKFTLFSHSHSNENKIKSMKIIFPDQNRQIAYNMAQIVYFEPATARTIASMLDGTIFQGRKLKVTYPEPGNEVFWIFNAVTMAHLPGNITEEELLGKIHEKCKICENSGETEENEEKNSKLRSKLKILQISINHDKKTAVILCEKPRDAQLIIKACRNMLVLNGEDVYCSISSVIVPFVRRIEFYLPNSTYNSENYSIADYNNNNGAAPAPHRKNWELQKEKQNVIEKLTPHLTPKTVKVTNLPRATTKSTIWHLFSVCGRIRNIVLSTEAEKGHAASTSAFVEYVAFNEMKNALAMNGYFSIGEKMLGIKMNPINVSSLPECFEATPATLKDEDSKWVF